MKLYIKNMVCNRCVMVVKQTLESLGYTPGAVNLGEAEIPGEITENDRAKIESAFSPLGFALIDDKKSRIIESIKNHIVELVHSKNSDLKVNLSLYLSNRLQLDYHYISNLFSEVTYTSIENFIILQKIELAKQLIELEHVRPSYELKDYSQPELLKKIASHIKAELATPFELANEISDIQHRVAHKFEF